MDLGKVSPVKLTCRQEVFLSGLLDAYREMQAPLHYRVIAKRLGVSDSTAYDMLRLLEQKGMISSMYATPKVTVGPGRSSILFVPTSQAIKLFTRLATGSEEQAEWEAVKSHIISRVRQGETYGYEDLMQQLLAQIPDTNSPLVRCAEIMAAFLITLRQTKHDFTRRSPLYKPLQAKANRPTMNLLAGLITGLCLRSRIGNRYLSRFQEHIKEYETSLCELSEEKLAQLYQFTQDIWRTLRKEQVA